MQEDNYLIEKAKNGDKFAFQKLVLKYDKLVLNIAYSYRNNKDDADDIYQEVFIRVYKGLKNFESRSKFTTWLYRITVNVCLEYKRKQKVHGHQSLNNNIKDDKNNYFENSLKSNIKTDTQTLNNETSEVIKQEVNKLPKQLKMAFTLKHYQGLKIKDISKLMNCSEGTIKSYLFTSNKKLRKVLQPLLGK